jgi:MFS superfamily sulfate permease-like transporter
MVEDPGDTRFIDVNIAISFRPKLLETLKTYSGKDFTADLIAGLTVGIVVLPLAMAFAIASGVKPEAGIFTAVIAGFLISAPGDTKVSIGGPTGAFIGILCGIHAKYGAENLAPSDPAHAHMLELENARQEIVQAFKRADEALGRAAGRTTTLPPSTGVSSVEKESDK